MNEEAVANAMKIKMLKTVCGSQDGFAVERFYKDEVYQVMNSLAASFIRNGAAKIERECV